MNITLPDDLCDLVTKRTEQAGLASVDEYVLCAVLAVEPEDLRGVDVEAWLRICLANGHDPLSIPCEEAKDHWQAIETELVMGLESGPPMAVTPEFWIERRRVLEERIARRQGTKQP